MSMTSNDATDTIDSRIKEKYAFIFRPIEDQSASERRYAWMKIECMPDDLVKLLDWMKNKKKKKVVNKDDKPNRPNKITGTGEDDDNETVIKKRDDLTRDYTEAKVVDEVIELLREERTKGHKFSPQYHVQVTSLMID